MQYVVRFWYSDKDLANKCEDFVKRLIEDHMVKAHNHFAELFDYEKWNAEFEPIGAKYENDDEWNSAYSAFIKQKQLEVIAADTAFRLSILEFSIDDENQLVGTVTYAFACILGMPELSKLSIKIYLKMVD